MGRYVFSFSLYLGEVRDEDIEHGQIARPLPVPATGEVSPGGARQEERPLLAHEVLGRHVAGREVAVGEEHHAGDVEAAAVRGEGAAAQLRAPRPRPVPQVGRRPPLAPAAEELSVTSVTQYRLSSVHNYFWLSAEDELYHCMVRCIICLQ